MGESTRRSSTANTTRSKRSANRAPPAHQMGVERPGYHRRIIAEHPAAPGPQHQLPVAAHGRDLQHPLGARGEPPRHLGHPVRGSPGDHSGVRRGRREEADLVRLRQQPAPVVAEHRDAGGVDDPVAVERARIGAVRRVELRHRPQTRVERRGPAQRLLLCLRAVQIAASGVARGGEIEHGDRLPGPPERQPARGFHAALRGHLERRGAVPRPGCRGLHRLRPVQRGPRRGPGDPLGEPHRAAPGRRIAARRDDALGLLGDAPQSRTHVRSSVMVRRGYEIRSSSRDRINRPTVQLPAAHGESPHDVRNGGKCAACWRCGVSDPPGV